MEYPQKISDIEMTELITILSKKSGINLPKTALDNDALDRIVFEIYDTSIESFESIANDLIQLTPIIQTNLTNKKIHAFLNFKKKYNEIIAKVEAR